MSSMVPRIEFLNYANGLVFFFLFRRYRDCTLFLSSSCVGRNCLSNNREIILCEEELLSQITWKTLTRARIFLTVLSFIFVADNIKTCWVLEAIFGVIYLTTTKFYSRKVYDAFCPIW